ncbi:MAG TPA: o-succinylbenzoate synthase [Terriglobales bacterium]|nr:o-succinylbenzoate synthase [Terriglobales bacterium]
MSGALTPIDSIEIREVSLPLLEPFATSYGRELSKNALIVLLRKGGHLALGECVAGTGPSYGKETELTAKRVIKEQLTPILLRRELRRPSEFLDMAQSIMDSRMAIAAVEMALWDLRGKTESTSLSKLLGGHGDEINACATIGIQSTPEQLIETVSRYVRQGYQTIKMKIEASRDIEFVRSVRRGFPEITLRVDANGAYSLKDLKILKELDRLGLSLIEQPLAFDDFFGHQALQKELVTPICLDESIQSLGDAKRAIEMAACRILNIKPGRVGGLLRATEIHDLCRECGVPVLCGGMLETGIGRAFDVALATLPGFTLPADLSASGRYFKRDVIRNEFELTKRGTLNVPTQPGCGVFVDDRFLDAVTTYKEILTKQSLRD